MSPDQYLAQKVSWQSFATLTFVRVPSDPVRQKMLFAWLRWFERLAQEQLRKRGQEHVRDGVLWMVREELGEVGGRFHFHALLAGLPAPLVNTRTMMASCSEWERLGGGMARNYPYASHLDGVAYVLKGLEEDLKATNRYGAYKYEVGKFCGEEGRRVLLGHSLLWRLAVRKSHKRQVTARMMRSLHRGN